MPIEPEDLDDFLDETDALGGLVAVTTTLGRFMREHGPFDIPYFQRPFRWRANPNWSDFWADWLSHLPAPFGIERRLGSFLGAVVLTAKEAAPDSRYGVLDGQQRLLTSVMALKALALHASRLDMTRERDLANAFLLRDDGYPRLAAGRANIQDQLAALRISEGPPPSFETQARPKLSMLERDDVAAGDHAEFGAHDDTDGEEDGDLEDDALTDDLSGEDDGIEDSVRLREAMRFFYERLDETLAATDAPEEMLRAMLRALLARMRIVVIILGPEDDGLEVFDRHNTRAELLSLLDRVKTTLLDVASGGRETGRNAVARAAELYDTRWAPVFDDRARVTFWEEPTRRVNDRRLNQDWFLRAYLSARARREVSGPKLLEETRRLLAKASPLESAEARADRACDTLRDLARHGEAFAQINGAPPLTQHAAQVERIRVFARFAVEPTLIALRVHHWEDEVALPRILDMLESCVVRRFFSRPRGSSDYDAFSRLCQALEPDAAGAALSARFLDALVTLRRERDFWPEDAPFKRGFQSREMATGTGRKPDIENKRLFRAVFGALEDQARGAAPGATEPPEDLTIEHLYPLNGRDVWKSPSKNQRKWLTTPGNLTLLDSTLNCDVGERPWSEKRAMIRDRSRSRLNQMLVNERGWVDQWGLEQIRERGAKLADLAAARWPGPQDPRWRRA